MRKLILLTVSLLVLIGSVSVNTSIIHASTDIPTHEISDRKAIIKWRYKNIDGKLYKRKYNYTTQKWIGSWEPVSK